MNHLNRLEQAWTPRWDLGLQEEFGFVEKPDAIDEGDPSSRTGWALATRETLQRQTSMDRRIAPEASSISELIEYFESLYGSEAASHE